MTVIHAVSELVPAVIGRGGYLSPKYQDRFSIKNVENDEEDKNVGNDEEDNKCRE